MKQYSFKKGLGKGLITALTFVATIIAFTQFADIQLWALVEQYVKPLLGATTVAGALGLAINFVKFQFSE